MSSISFVKSPEGSKQDSLSGTFQSSSLLAVVLAVLVDLLDAVLQLPDFSFVKQEKQGKQKISWMCCELTELFLRLTALLWIHFNKFMINAVCSSSTSTQLRQLEQYVTLGAPLLTLYSSIVHLKMILIRSAEKSVAKWATHHLSWTDGRSAGWL